MAAASLSTCPFQEIDSSFEDFFATPQPVDLAKLCEAHGFHHEQIQGWDSFILFDLSFT